jgi:hypothetical protein
MASNGKTPKVNLHFRIWDSLVGSFKGSKYYKMDQNNDNSKWHNLQTFGEVSLRVECNDLQC